MHVVVVVVVQVLPPGLLVAVYPVIGEPLAAAAVQAMTADRLPGAAVTPVGAPGTAAGVTALEAPDWGPVPTTLVAATLNV